MKNIIKTENLQEARKLIEKLAKEGKRVMVQGKDIEFNRIILENRKVSMLILSHKIGKDKLKERDSGLNHILCKLAKENNIALAINFDEIIASQGKERALILGRLMQNIKLCRKFKNKLRIINQPQDTYGLSALLRVLGADTKMAVEAVS